MFSRNCVVIGVSRNGLWELARLFYKGGNKGGGGIEECKVSEVSQEYRKTGERGRWEPKLFQDISLKVTPFFCLKTKITKMSAKLQIDTIYRFWRQTLFSLFLYPFLSFLIVLAFTFGFASFVDFKSTLYFDSFHYRRYSHITFNIAGISYILLFSSSF